MKRRSFFGAMAAAGIGGKKVATDVLEGMAERAIPMPGSPFPSGAINAAMGSGGDYLTHLQGQAAKMVALRASGIAPMIHEIMRSWSGSQQANLDDINSLVSVSISAKKRMIREKMEEQMVNEWFDRPARDLKRELLNKEFGVSI